MAPITQGTFDVSVKVGSGVTIRSETVDLSDGIIPRPHCRIVVSFLSAPGDVTLYLSGDNRI